MEKRIWYSALVALGGLLISSGIVSAAKKDVIRLAWWGGGIEMAEFTEDVLKPFEASIQISTSS